MKKRWIRFFSILLSICLLSTSVLAVDTENDSAIMPRYTYVAEIIMGFDIEIGGKSYCSTGVTLHNSNYSCSLEMTLQRNDGSGWEDIKTWTASSDGRNLDLEKYWYVTSGYEYRTYNTIRVYNSNGRLVETVTEESHTREY